VPITTSDASQLPGIETTCSLEGNGETCANGRCTGPPQPECLGQPDGATCSDGLPGAERCQNEECVAGACFLQPDNATCGPQQICFQGACESNPCEERPNFSSCDLFSPIPGFCVAELCIPNTGICSAANGTPEGFICGVDPVCRNESCEDETCSDTDGDDVCDPDDNCPTAPNTDQANADGDPAGDVCTPIDYVALGDSYSSGEGVVPYDAPTVKETNGCHRSALAYSGFTLDPTTMIPLRSLDPSTLLPQFEPLQDFLACSGAVTTNVLPETSGGVSQGWSAPDDVPQLDRPGGTGFQVDAETDLVTLTIGGNDSDFARVIKFCLAVSDCQNAEVDFDGTTLSQALPLLIETQVRPAVLASLGEIKTRAPNAAVIQAGYPLLLSGNECDAVEVDPLGIWKLEASEQTFLRGVGFLLNETLSSVAAEAGVQFVDDVSARFDGHEVCSSTAPSWIYGVSVPRIVEPNPDRFALRSFHPTQRGQLEYANAFNAYVQGRVAAGEPLLPSGYPENPASVVPLTAPAAAAAAAPLPELGDVGLSPTTPICTDTIGVFAPDQLVDLSGGGFAAGAAVSIASEQPGSSTAWASGSNVRDVTRGSNPDCSDEPRQVSDIVEVTGSITGDADGDGVPEVCDNCP